MVKLGLEKLRREIGEKKIALMMNHSAIDDKGKNLIDVIVSDWKCDVRFIFAMEHGVRGNMTTGFRELEGVDEKTGVRLECLYKFPNWSPPVELIETVDAVVFSAVDAGSRCYTYAPWMCYLISASAKAGKEVIVLDRPNPLGGEILEGGLMEPEYFNGLLGEFPYPLRHGLTIGEMAKMYNATLESQAKLTVVEMEGYNRNIWYEESGLLWTPPSPAIPTPETLLLYTGMVFFDHCNVSVGRGTALPFYYCGAPYVDAEWLANSINALNLSGACCLEAYWQPQFGSHKGEACCGILINITDKTAFNSTEFAVNLAFLLTNKYPDKINWNELELAKRSGSTLLGDALLGKIDGGVQAVLSKWKKDCEDFNKKRKQFLLY